MNLESAIIIEEIYKFNLHSTVDIAKFLGIWDNLSESEKNQLIVDNQPTFEKKYGNLSKEEIQQNLNNTEFWEEYNDNFVYGEISKSGVNKLSKYLSKFSGVFYDIGSGNGKLILHLSLLTNFEKYIGVEIVELRHLYANKINEVVRQDVQFICGDVLKLDISDANFIFFDDLMFPKQLRLQILDIIPHDCYYLTTWKNDEDFIENWKIGVSWLDTEMDFYLYKKR